MVVYSYAQLLLGVPTTYYLVVYSYEQRVVHEIIVCEEPGESDAVWCACV